ncbi:MULTISPECIES: GerAB/ArcD/ProY family transporter [Bacillus cereus group]|uniref:GerAB/ArcD/ProY family transporter n=1 Tax=Bacillus TaxID=1386 RepID=UPI0001A1D21D|nr:MULTISPECIES: endospore germination permease [Bacillus cereus group]EEM68672.1 Spore germination protein KB [Bacillus thuringiensis serovar andalousiensis BGSC 4AW1]MEB9631805.1 endospore germination permease [Bacillus anthracis]OUB01718.1 hypothetical protein BK714_03600 [Bacillus thuringiensis serovar oswaldocruzi]
MNKKKIGVFQLFALIVLFELGSALILGVGLKANKDAWIALLIGTICGIGLFFFYSILYKLSGEGTSFLQMWQAGFGHIFGKFITFFYIAYFLYISMRVTADFAFFINEYLLLTLQDWIIKLTILLLTAYVCYLGIETIGRSAEFLFIIMIFFILFIIFCVLFQEGFYLNHLRPVLENGWDPIFKAVFPQIITFPFGECIVFLCLFQFVGNFSAFIKKGWIAILISGLVLMIVSILNICVLTVDIAKSFAFPFIKTIEHIHFLNFLRHLELLAVVVFIIGGFIKILIFFYASITGVAELFNVTSFQKIIVPVMMIVYFISVFFMKNFITHIYIGLKIIPLSLHLVFQGIVPFVLLIILYIRWVLRKTDKA